MTDNPTTSLAPHGPFEGYQNFTNTACVTGWAWDRSKPHARIAVEIWDGETVLGTMTADAFRADVRSGGIGDGRHAFTYPLDSRIRDRRTHPITVRIAGTTITLRDAATGAMPRPITRRDRPMPEPIPYFSMPPLERWFYFTLLRRLLKIFPGPVWRLPAMALGIVHMILDRQERALNVALLQAIGMAASFADRWRLHWCRAYQRQADILLLAQVERVTPRWAAEHVRLCGALPPGGAILVTVHHETRRLAPLVLAASGYRLGAITTRGRDPVTIACADPTLRAHWQLAEAGDASAFGDRRFTRREVGRKGLHLLAEGGVLDDASGRICAPGALLPATRPGDDRTARSGLARAALGQADYSLHDRP